MLSTSTLNGLVTFARRHSRYYRLLHADAPRDFGSLSQLPVVDPGEYWKDAQHLDRWPVLTGEADGALVFKTGGTTGDGKLSVFSRDEWHMLTRDFGRSLALQLNHGDRVANLFFVGDLYASFIFVHDALAHVGTAITEYPFTGSVDPAPLAEAVVRNRINVLAGVPAQLLTFAAWLAGRGQTLEGVTALLYGGESVFAGQRRLLERAFPRARVASIGYASVDAGLIGTRHPDCAMDEHRTPDGHSLLEILDEETGEAIEACNRPGRLVVTNLTRRLMPLIRYPVGDRACWREPPGTPQRKFALTGRSSDSQRVRVGILSLEPHAIGECVRRITASDDWQLLIEQCEGRDFVSLNWVPDTSKPDVGTAGQSLHDALTAQNPQIERLIADGLLELRIGRCTVQQLLRHPRSGKCRRVVDLRPYQNQPQEQP
ncbi:phenylacetate--CoA ligase family protein [Pseudomonas sp. B35(2017)]|uniref:phenylacetate--CoA ligase family protein n=1 Tax=Pseudomonas sp. B35(2017) TaxID=1981722 RepID=UPI000A1EEA7D|nr:AMP-binding protein [Pseudomonas sp. B35(2017)]